MVFAFTTLESFANEVIANEVKATSYKYTATRSTKEAKPGEKFTYGGEALERNVSLNEKLAQVLPDALGVTSPKGLHLWRGYKSLKEWRDRIIHLKSSSWRVRPSRCSTSAKGTRPLRQTPKGSCSWRQERRCSPPLTAQLST